MKGMMTKAVSTHDEVVRIPESLVRIVADAIAVSWRCLIKQLENENIDLGQLVEDEITERLHMILGELEDQPDEELRDFVKFQTPVRGGNVRSYNGVHLDKQPDLAFRPVKGSLGRVGNTVTAGIFIECKPIDRARPVGSVYCRNGLNRFVNGDYSWRVDRAMMVGYVRNAKKLPEALKSVLSKPEMRTALGYSGSMQEKKSTGRRDNVWSTTHERKFTLNGVKVPEIQVDHLWLYPEEPFDSNSST